ncbi:MAG: helix-hairpin-helix domain-containing protein [Acidimicrobiia bacterium]|nr:helix-hairpin-helix domain-containing protein [Acidimicrobiia bacterium]
MARRTGRVASLASLEVVLGSMISLLGFVFRAVTTVAGVALLFWLLRDRLVHLTPRRTEFISPVRPAPADVVPPKADITVVKGIGPVYAERLATVGINGLVALAGADSSVVAEAAGVPEERAMEWIADAASRS